MNQPRIELHREADAYYLQIEGHAPIGLSRPQFTHLARQFVTQAHSIPEILEPPFVVRLHAQYNVDGDQQTPLFVDDWAFAERSDAELFLDLAQADVQVFRIRWPFRLWIPAVPELEYVPSSELDSVDRAVTSFRLTLLTNFFDEAGEDYWNKHLTRPARLALWEFLANSDYPGNLPCDPAEIESWAKDGVTLMEQNRE